MSSWPIRTTRRPVHAFSEGPVHDLSKPNKLGGLSGDTIVLPEETNMRVVEQVEINPRIDSRWLAKTTGKLAGPDGVMKQWWAYIGKDDFQVEGYIPPPRPVEQVSVSALTKS